MVPSSRNFAKMDNLNFKTLLKFNKGKEIKWVGIVQPVQLPRLWSDFILVLLSMYSI